ncbi:MAG: ribokinase [Treponema sp.]|nr:ribokinase [Treponema sp.]
MNKILNIGSLNSDHVYSVPHFVTAGETLAATTLQYFPGGKGLNQSIALSRAGAMVFHAGKVGPDGVLLTEWLRESGVDIHHTRTNGSVTGHAIIQVAPGGQNCILLYHGANFELERSHIDQVFSCFDKGDILVLQNEVNDIPYIMEQASQKDMRIAFNPSPFDSSIADYPLDCVSWFILNEIEGTGITGKENPKDILQSMAVNFPKAAIVLTLGKDGVLYKDSTGELSHESYNVPVVDTTAAGDTFTGFFIANIAAGKKAEEALRMASIAASIAVTRPGASSSIPTREEVELK